VILDWGLGILDLKSKIFNGVIFMKSYLRLFIPAIALMFLFNTFASAQIQQEILKRMDEHQKALTSLTSSITMDKFNSQLDEHDVYEGTVNYLPAKGRDALVRLDWTSPQQEMLSVVNKQYILCRPRLKECIAGNVDSQTKKQQGTGLFGFINMSKEELKANYAVVYQGKEDVRGGIPTWHLQLNPKTPQSYKSAELWVDGNGMPLQAKINENNNDSTTVLLYNLQKNVTINASTFVIKPPKDWKITKP
jgi:outer membrane lipoprotein-sorting protein